jgi:hypothetical protein
MDLAARTLGERSCQRRAYEQEDGPEEPPSTRRQTPDLVAHFLRARSSSTYSAAPVPLVRTLVRGWLVGAHVRATSHTRLELGCRCFGKALRRPRWTAWDARPHGFQRQAAAAEPQVPMHRAHARWRSPPRARCEMVGLPKVRPGDVVA